MNPDLSPTPMTVRVRTTCDDFPAKLDHLVNRNVAIGFLRQDGIILEIPIVGLNFIPDGDVASYGGAAHTVEVIASLRRSMAQN